MNALQKHLQKIRRQIMLCKDIAKLDELTYIGVNFSEMEKDFIFLHGYVTCMERNVEQYFEKLHTISYAKNETK